MEACLAADELSVFAEGAAAVGDDGIEVVQGFEMAVDDGRVDVDPQGLGGLQFRRVGRQEGEADALGHGERRGVPAGAVEHEHDDALGSGADLAREQREGLLEERLADACREIPEALAGGG